MSILRVRANMLNVFDASFLFCVAGEYITVDVEQSSRSCDTFHSVDMIWGASAPCFATGNHPERTSMAKNTNTFEKRRKEMERMRKAQEKRERRLARRSASVDPESPDGPPTVPESDQRDAQSAETPPV